MASPKMIMVFLTALLFVSSGYANPPVQSQYKVACEVSLIGNKTNQISAESLEKTAPQGPYISFDLGDYVLSAGVSAMVLSPATEKNPPHDFTPELAVSLYKKSEGPISGQVNYMALPASEILVGQSLSVSSLSFLSLSYQDAKYSRIDYICHLTRIN